MRCATAHLALALAAFTGAASAAAGSADGGSSSCPSSNPPGEIQLVAGSPQSALVGGVFGTTLEVVLANSNGCPVTGAAGVPVTFTGPASGPGGTFAGSGSSTVTVGADSQGDATAPAFSADLIAGSYAITAVSTYGSVRFLLTNSASGVPARLMPALPTTFSAQVTHRYSKALAVRVLDANGAPIPGVPIAFAISAASGTNRCGGAEGAGATFMGGQTQASATTNAAGIASSPPLSANASAGSFSASATLSSPSTGGSPSSSQAAQTLAPLSFALSNQPGSPHTLTAGVGASQSSILGERFPIPLAVAVTDAQKNPVPHALITFTAPADGASGHFRHHGRQVKVRSDACGIAVAPPFSANDSAGGYIVRATLGHLHSAAFGLVNGRA